MKKTVLILMLGVLFIASNLFAADGDFIVEGNVGIGTSAPSNKLELLNGNIMLKDSITSGYAESPNKIILQANAQVPPAIEFCGMSGCGQVSYDSDNGRFNWFGGGFGMGFGHQIIWGQSGSNTITATEAGDILVYSRDSFTISTKNDNSGIVTIPYGSFTVRNDALVVNTSGNIGVGTTTPTEKLEVNGGVKLNTTSAKPTCSVTTRGTLWFTQSAINVKDILEVCAKNASNVYAWRLLY